MYIICYIIIIYCKIINYNYYKYKYLNNTFKYQTYYLKQRSIYCVSWYPSNSYNYISNIKSKANDKDKKFYHL